MFPKEPDIDIVKGERESALWGVKGGGESTGHHSQYLLPQLLR